MTTQTTPNELTMHRFIPGLAKLPEKRKNSQTERRQRDCDDRSKRNQGYIREWEKEYAWLAYDDEKNVINAFAIGTDNLRHDSLRAHDNVSEAHRRAIDRDAANNADVLLFFEKHR